LEAATSLADPGAIRGNRLEVLKGDRAGQHSIRINDERRSCLNWREGNAYDIEIVDHHEEGRVTAQRKRLPPVHPGELLGDELHEIGVSLNELARALRVPMNRISAIVSGKRAISVDAAMRLARYFGTSPQYWLNLQSAYDLEVAEREIRPRIEKDVLPRSAA
jgi:addiction module HigA family antidote